MKGSLFDIFQRHRDCYDFRKDPTHEEQRNQPEARQLMADRFRERKQAASEYASSLIPLGNDWIEAVKHDVNKLATTLPPSLHFNKAERKAYRDGVEDFLLDVAAALREHGKGKFLNDEYFDPVTLYRFGIEYSRNEIRKGLSTEDAEQMYKAMKQRYSQVYCFPDLFSMIPVTYTVMGCKAKASTQAQAQNKADSSKKGTGNNTTANPETPPATQKTPKVAALQPYTPKPVGRTAGLFAETIANTYKDKAEIIQEHTGTALASMTDPKAVIALFVVYFQKGILKQSPTYWQALRLLDIEAEKDTDKEKLCPFGMHQQYDIQRKIYFDKNNSYLSLNDTDSKQDNEISSFVIDAEREVKTLLSVLNPQPQQEARKGA